MPQPAVLPPTPVHHAGPAKSFEDIRRESRLPIVLQFKRILDGVDGLNPKARTDMLRELGAWIGDLGSEANAMVHRAFVLADALGLNEEALSWPSVPIHHLLNFVLPELEARTAAAANAKGPAH
ncbi:MAG: hypothetical protein WCO25_01045 [Candidatus Uhrbacteria bacterium]